MCLFLIFILFFIVLILIYLTNQQQDLLENILEQVEELQNDLLIQTTRLNILEKRGRDEQRESE